MEVMGKNPPTNMNKALLSECKPPQSMVWRAYHCTLFFFAGLQFLIASILLYPYFWDAPVLNASGWMYTIGSSMFLLADLTELWYYKEGDESGIETMIFSNNCLGSFTYIVGSVYAIPAVAWADAENAFFVGGSLLIMISQFAKIQRPIAELGYKGYLRTFGIPLFLVDLTTGIGAFFYFSGSSCGLAYPSGSSQPFCSLNGLATQLSFGGYFFTMAGACMIYRYFFSPSMPHSTLPTSLGPCLPFSA